MIHISLLKDFCPFNLGRYLHAFYVANYSSIVHALPCPECQVVTSHQMLPHLCKYSPLDDFNKICWLFSNLPRISQIEKDPLNDEANTSLESLSLVNHDPVATFFSLISLKVSGTSCTSQSTFLRLFLLVETIFPSFFAAR